MIVSNSQRLTYRLMTLQDANLLFEIDQDPAVLKYINGGKVSSMEEINTLMIPRLQQYLSPQKGWGIWQINTLADNQYIGWVLVRPMDFFSEAPQLDNLELGWRFKAEYWGRGYATESASHLMQTLSENESVQRFCAIAVPENKASIRIMEKLRMQYVKTYVHKDPLFEWEVAYYECGSSEVKA